MLYAGANADFPGDGNAMEFSTCLVSNISQLNDRDNQSLMRINVARFWLLTTIALTIGATIWWSSEDERWEVIPGFVGKQLKAVAAAAFPGQVDGVKASGLLQERSNQPLEESPQCHNVRNVRGGDRCSFVQAHCKGEKVGFINYLSIYYCGPRLIMPVAAVAWLVMLFMIVNIGASEFLCGNLSTISNILGMSQSLVSSSSWAYTRARRTTEP
jgi:hypothetical protein